MALMERVVTLLRANVNELIDRAEDPETMIRQLLLDMENQLLQVKTQVAMAIADQHLLEKKTAGQEMDAQNWRTRAELALTKGEDELARLALERSLTHDALAEGFRKQLAEQTVEAGVLRTTYNKLQGKLKETEAQCELLASGHRRAHLVRKAAAAQRDVENGASRLSRQAAPGRFKAGTSNRPAGSAVQTSQLADTLEARFAALELDGKVEKLLSELKGKQPGMLEAG